MTSRVQQRLDELAEIIVEAGKDLPQTGGIQETLKWGQRAFLPKKARIGTTVRIAAIDEHNVAMYVHCQTSLVDTFRTLYPDWRFEGNRAILFDARQRLPKIGIAMCAEAAFLYHWNKRAR